MLLAFDVGNTNIVVGVFSKTQLDFVFRLQTDPRRTVDEYSAILLPLLERKLGKSFSIEAAIVSSVVPPLTADIVALITGLFQVCPLVLAAGVKTGLILRVKDPVGVGADRVANAVSAKSKCRGHCAVVDFGTATTIDYIGEKGEYEGGMIIPGLQISADALFARAAKLPRIELAWPTRIIGNDTVSAVQAGTVLGYACLIEGLLHKIASEMGSMPTVITTGELGEMFAQHSPLLAQYEPHLLLEGLRMIAEQNELRWESR
jgi:type III pantothenate kinase